MLLTFKDSFTDSFLVVFVGSFKGFTIRFASMLQSVLPGCFVDVSGVVSRSVFRSFCQIS